MEQTVGPDRAGGVVSAIIVTYKQQDFLLQTIDSVLMQDCPAIELIIADDGTPELDVGRLKDHIERNQRGNITDTLVLYDGTNRGTVRNVNRALRASTGEYVKLIGGDDTYTDETVFTRQVEAARQSAGTLGVISKCRQCDAFMNPIPDDRVERSNAAIPDVLRMEYGQARRYIAKNDIFPLAVQTALFRWTFFEENGLCDEDYALIDDSPTVLKILRNNARFVFLDAFAVNHRSDVGISTSRELFAPRRLLYYRDCVTYARKEIAPNPDVYGRLYCAFIPAVNRYVYEMAAAKSENRGLARLLLISLRHFPALVYYFLHNAKKVLLRIRRAAPKGRV